MGFGRSRRGSRGKIFYPVLDRSYAKQIARDWNTTDATSGYAGFVTQFEVPDSFAGRYPVRVAGNSELWIPAADVLELNSSIVGRIEVVEAYVGSRFKGSIDPESKLPTLFSDGDLQTVYRLKDVHDMVTSIQQATLTTEKFGIEPTHD